MKFIIAVIFLLLLATPLEAAIFHPVTRTLKNGLQIIVVVNRLAPVATHMLWIKAGSIDETPGKSGLAHYLEHLMFKGTQKFPAGEYSRRIARVGGTENAFTLADATAFHASVAKQQLPLIMELEADRLTGLTIEINQATPELKVVMDEWRQRIASSPTALFSQQVGVALFPLHPYGRPVIGWKEEIESLTVEDAHAFYTKWYHPANAVVVVSGDVKPEEVFQLAEKYYGALPAIAPAQRSQPVDPPFNGDALIRGQDPRLKEAFVLRNVRAPSSHMDGKTAHAFEVLEELLGGSDAAFLPRRLIQERKLASTIDADYNGDVLGEGEFSVTASPAQGTDPDILLKEIDAALKDFAATPVDEKMLGAAKTGLRRAADLARDSGTGPAYIFGMALVSGQSIEDVENWPEHIAAVTAAEVQDAARRLIQTRKVEGILTPGGALTPEQQREQDPGTSLKTNQGPIR